MRIYGYNGQKLLISDDHTTRQIMQLLLSQDGKYCDQVKEFTDGMQGMDSYDACKTIWTSLKRDVKYVPDDESMQNLKSPARLVYDGFGDCKSYSLAIACCLRNLGIPYAYRFVSFTNDRTPTHVYVVAYPGTKDECIIDCVLSNFDYEKPYRHKIDKKMALSMLTGISDNNSSEVSYGTKVMRTRQRMKNGKTGMNGFWEDVTHGRIKKAFTTDLHKPGVDDAEKQGVDINTQFINLQKLQDQKQAIANNSKLSYTDAINQVNAVQSQQNAAIKKVLDDIVAKTSDDKRTAAYNNAFVKLGELIVNSTATILVSVVATPLAGAYVASGLTALELLAINPIVAQEDQTLILKLKPFLAASFPFTMAYYTKNQANTSAAAKTKALSPSQILQQSNAIIKTAADNAAKITAGANAGISPALQLVQQNAIQAAPAAKATPANNTYVQPAGSGGSAPMSTGQKVGIGVGLAAIALFVANESGAIKLSKIFK